MEYFKGLKEKDRQHQRRRIKKLSDKWVRPIGLGWFKIDIRYYDSMVGESKTGAAGDCAMEITVNWQYLDATLRVNLDVTSDLSDEELEEAFVHELMHIYVHEMREWQNEDEESTKLSHEERVVTQLARAMIWAVKNVKHEKKAPRKSP